MNTECCVASPLRPLWNKPQLTCMWCSLSTAAPRRLAIYYEWYSIGRAYWFQHSHERTRTHSKASAGDASYLKWSGFWTSYWLRGWRREGEDRGEKRRGDKEKQVSATGVAWICHSPALMSRERHQWESAKIFNDLYTVNDALPNVLARGVRNRTEKAQCLFFNQESFLRSHKRRN